MFKCKQKKKGKVKRSGQNVLKLMRNSPADRRSTKPGNIENATRGISLVTGHKGRDSTEIFLKQTTETFSVQCTLKPALFFHDLIYTAIGSKCFTIKDLIMYSF